MLTSGEWLEHPYRRPKTYCEILDQRQQRQQRVLGGGHPRLDGGSREPSVHTLIPQRRRGVGAAAVGAHEAALNPDAQRAGRRVGWADAQGDDSQRDASAPAPAARGGGAAPARAGAPAEHARAGLRGTAPTARQAAAKQAQEQAVPAEPEVVARPPGRTAAQAVAAAAAAATAAASRKPAPSRKRAPAATRTTAPGGAVHRAPTGAAQPRKVPRPCAVDDGSACCGEGRAAEEGLSAEAGAPPSVEASAKAEAVRLVKELASISVQTSPVVVQSARLAGRAQRARDERGVQMRRLYDELARSDGEWRKMVDLLATQLEDSRRQVQLLEALERSRGAPRAPRGGVGAPSMLEVADARRAAHELAHDLERAETAGAAGAAEQVGHRHTPQTTAATKDAAAAAASAADAVQRRQQQRQQQQSVDLYPAPQRLCAWGTSAAPPPPRAARAPASHSAPASPRAAGSAAPTPSAPAPPAPPVGLAPAPSPPVAGTSDSDAPGCPGPVTEGAAASPSSPPGAPATAASCGSPGAVPLPTPMGAARRGARRPPGARLEATDESAAALERDGEADDVFEEEEEEEEGQAPPPPQQQGDNGDGFERGGGAGTSQPWGLRPSAAAAALHLSDALAEPPAAAAPMAELPKSATKCNAQRDPTAARLAPRSASATALIKEARAALSADGPVRVRSAKQLFGAH